MRPKGTKEELEARRKLAVKQLLKGKGVREGDREFEVYPSPVSRWIKVFEEGTWESFWQSLIQERSLRLPRTNTQSWRSHYSKV